MAYSTSHATSSPKLMQMLNINMSRTLIEYFIDCIVDTVDNILGQSSKATRGRTSSRLSKHHRFSHFVHIILDRAEIGVSVLLVTLLYVDRARPHLQIAVEEWANERVFLGALILANKFCNDSTIKNSHWALCTEIFGVHDINRIEREFLDVLDYELNFDESELLAFHEAIMDITHPSHSHAHRAHHQHHRHTPPLEQSHWSDSDPEYDTLSSRSASPLPLTPITETFAVAPPVSVVSAGQYKMDDVGTPSYEQHPAPTDAQSGRSQHHHHHHHHTSSFAILKAFPMPKIDLRRHRRQASSQDQNEVPRSAEAR